MTTQGSTALATPAAPASNLVDFTRRRRTQLTIELREQAAGCKAIEKIAIACQNEGHASLEDVETIQGLARMMARYLEALANEIAS